MINIDKKLYDGLKLRLKQLNISYVKRCDIDELTDRIDLSEYKLLYEHYVNNKPYKTLGIPIGSDGYRELTEKLRHEGKTIVAKRRLNEKLDIIRRKNKEILEILK